MVPISNRPISLTGPESNTDQQGLGESEFALVKSVVGEVQANGGSRHISAALAKKVKCSGTKNPAVHVSDLLMNGKQTSVSDNGTTSKSNSREEEGPGRGETAATRAQ